MTNNLSIKFDWLHRDNGDALERATLAELAMTANKYSAFELEDLTAKSIRKSARVSAYNLAVWFVSNWWKTTLGTQEDDLRMGLQSQNWRSWWWVSLAQCQFQW